MQDNLNNLTVLRNILCDDVFSAFVEYSNGNSDSFADFVFKFYNRKKFPEAGMNFMSYVESLVFYDENAYSRSAANGEVDTRLESAYVRDIEIIFNAVKNADAQGYYINTPVMHSNDQTSDEIAKSLRKRYFENGYGRYLLSYALRFENGELAPSGMNDDITLDSLKDYKTEKALIESNIQSFLLGLPYSNMLLYGDRGTGKSSTVRAMAKKFSDRKLRLIELDSRSITKIPEIRKLVATEPMKFIIFIDDLSITENDEMLSSLKVCLEGTSATSKNTMIVATSNRRHIIKENFSDRENAVHSNDVIQDQLSLSDRFGMTIMFSSAGKAEYLSIVRQLAEDENLNLAKEELFALAERWAITKGGRSPRRARQLIDLLVAAQAKGVDPDF